MQVVDLPAVLLKRRLLSRKVVAVRLDERPYEFGIAIQLPQRLREVDDLQVGVGLEDARYLVRELIPGAITYNGQA